MIDHQPSRNVSPNGNDTACEPAAAAGPAMRLRRFRLAAVHVAQSLVAGTLSARLWILALGHAFVFVGVYWLAFACRFDFAMPNDMVQLAIITVPWVVFVKLAIFYACGQYHGWWRYVTFADLRALGIASSLSLVMLVIVDHFVLTVQIPRIVLALDFLLTIFVLGALRASVRAVREQVAALLRHPNCKRAVVIGADDSAGRLAHFIRSQAGPEYWVRGFLSNNGERTGDRLGQIPVLGRISELAYVADRYGITDVLCPVGTLPGGEFRDLMLACKQIDLQLKVTPPCDDIFRGNGSIPTREIQIDDLLRRDPIQLDTESIATLLKGRVVMVTGAGGSIGSEICRQIVKFQPRVLVLVGRGENRIFAIDGELRALLKKSETPADAPTHRPTDQPTHRLTDQPTHRLTDSPTHRPTDSPTHRLTDQPTHRLTDSPTHRPTDSPPPCQLHARIADITDRDRMHHLFHEFHPDVIFHAAAHKHVPLMEENVGQAIKNNVLGTRCLADLADQHGVSSFVMISTDKAVNPTSVMGTTKHLAERYVMALSEQSSTKFVVTRFGNVLGSAQSVVPIFQKQIRHGGPITITDRRMRRFFMTIPEASQLVLQAAAMGDGGEIFLLDMGEPVLIIDLARDLIRLSGLPEDAIEIITSGIRPGEKLYEELYFDEETTLPTDHPKLRAAYHRQYDPAQVEQEMLILQQHVGLSADEARRVLQQLVPEYQPMGESGISESLSPASGKRCEVGGDEVVVS